MATEQLKKSLTAPIAFRFVIVIGVANLFADMTYKGARSSTGFHFAFLALGGS